VADEDRPKLYVCTTCRQAGTEAVADDGPGDAPRDGQRLFDAVCERLEALGAKAPVDVVPIVCFANCEQGCSAGLVQTGKWAYMVGHIGPGEADDLIAYGAAYAKSETGAVLRSGRPESLRHAIVGRFPTQLAFPQSEMKDAAE
jgi:predicted metal-binding protein